MSSKKAKNRVKFEEIPNGPLSNKNNSLNRHEISTRKKSNKNNNNTYSSEDIKNLPTCEYIEATVQKDIQNGLLNLARMQPSDPIKYLGEYLLEKSKNL